MTSEISANVAEANTLTEFIETDKGEGFLSSIEYDLDYAADILNGGGVDWVARLIANYDGDHMEDDVLSTIEDAAGQFEAAASTIRNFMVAYFEQRGAIKLASDAVEAFAAAPTESNRLALVQASEDMGGYHFISMPRALKGKLRPFVTSRIWRSRISFGSLNWIANEYLKVEAPVSEAA